MHKSSGAQGDLRDMDEEEGSAEHPMAMRSGAIKYHMLHEVWLGVTNGKDGFGMKKTTIPCPPPAPAPLQPFLSSLPASSPSPIHPRHPPPTLLPPSLKDG